LPNLIDLNLCIAGPRRPSIEYTEDGQVSNMTAPSPTNPDLLPGDTTSDTDKRCAACQHRWAEHDGISARYCAATIVNGSARGCVCVPNATTDNATMTN
jgi:hypothetical protein